MSTDAARRQPGIGLDGRADRRAGAHAGGSSPGARSRTTCARCTKSRRPRRRRLLPGPLEPRQGGALHPRGELHRLLLVEGVRQGRHHHLGDPADRLPVGRARTARSTSPAAARAARRSPGTPTRRPGSATPTSAACCCRCTARPRRSTTATRSRPGRTSSTTRQRAKAVQVRPRQGRPGPRDLGRGRPSWSRPPTCTRSRSGARTGSPGSRRSRRCRWSRTPPAPGSPR